MALFPLALALFLQPVLRAAPPASRVLSPVGNAPGFTRLAPEATGIAFTNLLTPAFAAANQIRMNGSGVAAVDVDGDGRCDLFFCGVETPARLYRNLGGWKFEDVTASAGLDFTGTYTTGAVFADVDGDGDLDLLVNSLGGGTREFLNDGHGHFSERLDSGLLRKHGAMSMALADVDGDGDLDLYVANYRTTTIRTTGFSILRVNGQRMIRPEDRDTLEYTPQGAILEHGEPDVLYLNDGTGRFTAVPWDQGAFVDEIGRPLAKAPRDWGLSVQFRDIDGDGSPDLYVCNDFHSVDRVWLNDGKGRFRALPSVAMRCTPTFSMSVDFADINRDGVVDFFVADMLDTDHASRMRRSAGIMAAAGDYELASNRPQNGRNVLHLGRGDGTFAEVAQQYGIEATGWTWSAAFLDVDLDGYEDLLTTGGNLFDTQDLDANARIDAGGPYRADQIPGKLLKYGPRVARRYLYRNLSGKGFEEVGKGWGFWEEGVAHGMCLADLDGDGDLDVVVNELNGAAGVYRNEGGAGRVAVRLKGSGGNTRGIGARVTLRGGAVGSQSQEMMAGGRYLSGDEAMRVYASGKAVVGMELEVRWRNGKRSVVRGVESNREYEIEEAGSEAVAPEAPGPAKEWFREVELGHVHAEEGYDDFERQGLLPRKLSQGGPGVGWMDVDGDGREDLVVGSGKGGKMGVYRNNGKGGFEAMEGPAAEREQTGVAGWPEGNGKTRVVYGTSNYAEGSNLGGGAETWSPGRAPEAAAKGPWGASGTVALAEVKGDGELELLVGSRVRGGRYPESDGARLYQRKGNGWELDAANTEVLRTAELAVGAVWTDVDGDGYPELVVACEWGPLRVYRNEKGKLREVEMGLGKYRGFWNGVSAGDFDGDGRMDLVASNWGTNTRHRGRPGKPERMYYGDLSGLGQVETLEAEEEGGKWYPARDLNAVGKVLPWMREKYGTHGAYAVATMEEVLAGREKAARVVEADWMETSVFLNRGDHFELARLPVEAQRAVGYGVNVGDADGDGSEDIYIAQNFFGVGPQESRSDAGRGLWLKGDGKGGFRAVNGNESGVKVYGEGRGSALGDYDGDGRVDLVTTQNGGATRLYHNETAKRGLRVGLKGGDGNRVGYGAVIRLEYKDGSLGPAREVHGGSGYWSQDGAVQVMGLAREAVAVRVKWPGGKETRTEVPEGTWECRIDAEGKLEKR